MGKVRKAKSTSEKFLFKISSKIWKGKEISREQFQRKPTRPPGLLSKPNNIESYLGLEKSKRAEGIKMKFRQS